MADRTYYLAFELESGLEHCIGFAFNLNDMGSLLGYSKNARGHSNLHSVLSRKRTPRDVRGRKVSIYKGTDSTEELIKIG